MKTLQELVAEAKSQTRVLTPDQAAHEIKQHPHAACIDVREPGEHAQGHVDGFVNIPRGVLEMSINSLAQQADTPIYLHCATGGRASLAALSLQKMGFTQVNVIEGDCDSIRDAVCGL